jgi:quercetin dioxygenase-like cupin family protein
VKNLCSLIAANPPAVLGEVLNTWSGQLTIAVLLVTALSSPAPAEPNSPAAHVGEPALKQVQVADPVQVVKEPHHHLKIENEYMRALRVSVPAGQATLLHQHDVPYLYVSIGPGDVANDVLGKPPARIQVADGQVGYSAGHFAHIARADAGIPFENVTVELLQPQGEVRNLCEKVGPGGTGKCDRTEDREPLIETDNVEVVSVRIQSNSPATKLDNPSLIISAKGSLVAVGGMGSRKTLRPGEFIWAAAHSSPQFTAADGEAHLVVISFKSRARN